MSKTLWYVLGAFLVYWYILKQKTTAQLIDTVKGTVSTGFSPVNQAGQTTGAAADPGTHDSYPGATIEPAPVKAYLPSRQAYPKIPAGATLPGGGPILRL